MKYFILEDLYFIGWNQEDNKLFFNDFDDLIVMPYMHISDRENKSVYWNDVIKWFGHEVKNIGGRCIQARPERFILVNNIPDLIRVYNVGTMMEGDIIGNIIENPELKELLK